MKVWLLLMLFLRYELALKRFRPSFHQKTHLTSSLCSAVDASEYRIEIIEGRTSIIFTNTSQNEKPFYIDFVEHASRFERSPQSELVCKALGKCDIVYDLTAGLGRDSLVLSMTGRTVIMFERNPILHALLHDALQRLAIHRIDKQLSPLKLSLINLDSTSDDFTSLAINEHLQVSMNTSKESPSKPTSIANSNSVNVLTACVYLDPMYPAGAVGRKSLVKKETQVLHRLVGDAQGADEENNRRLFDSAVKLLSSDNSMYKAGNGRIVVKRPARAAPLLGLTPHSVVQGSTQRFDIYFANQLPNRFPLKS